MEKGAGCAGSEGQWGPRPLTWDFVPYGAYVSERDPSPHENLGPEGSQGRQLWFGDVLPWANDGADRGETRNSCDSPGVGPHLWSAQLSLGPKHPHRVEPVHLILAGRIPPGQVRAAL